ncbi:MarR family transcriptional regulator [Pantoea stewartii]|nr:MarR family transcriptional regulator [Pantoea stewartii]
MFRIVAGKRRLKNFVRRRIALRAYQGGRLRDVDKSDYKAGADVDSFCLVQISRFGPIGVVELADRVGRDYTTVSRQVAKLEEAGLAQRQKNVKDKRINEAAITQVGRAMTNKIDAAREKIYKKVFLRCR